MRPEDLDRWARVVELWSLRHPSEKDLRQTAVELRWAWRDALTRELSTKPNNK